MVQRQRDKWPWTDRRRKFNPSKTRIDVLRSALLDASLGFTLGGCVDNEEASGVQDENGSQQPPLEDEDGSQQPPLDDREGSQQLGELAFLSPFVFFFRC
jgi:hypothetical protein